MPNHQALQQMRLAVEVLATNAGPIRTRLQAAEPYFGAVHESTMQTPAEERLRMRIGASLVEGGDEADDTDVSESIALLDETRVVEIAADMLLLYEILAGIRTDDDYELPE